MSRRTRVGGIAAAMAALLSALLLAVPQPAAAAHPHAKPKARSAGLRWGLCPYYLYPDLRHTGEQCAHLDVPLDYDHPRSGHVTLELSRLRHTSAHYKGVILTNPGGPGAPGLDLPASLEPFVPGGVGADYDWVSWDPRGVGASSPAMHCEPGYFKGPRRNYKPTSAKIVKYWLTRTKRYAAACAKKYPRLINNISTRDSARDMDRIRRALGVNKISFYGFSYGTYLGEVYSTLFPSHLKYLVLDSTVDPRRVWWGANLDQDKAFQRNIGIFFAWVASWNNVYHLGSSAQEVSLRYNSELAELSVKPKGKLGPDEFADAITEAAYYRFGWTQLAHAWHLLDAKGKRAPMIKQYVEADTPGNDNEFAVYSAVQCSDAHWPRSWAKWKAVNTSYARKYPFLTWNNAWFNAPCLYWHAKQHHPLKINGKHTASVLMIDETLDAATPYSGSLEVRKLYPNASLIAEPGGMTHADSLSGDSCVDDKIARYLRTGKRPVRRAGDGPDARCKPLPNPRPHPA
ncbi:MAG TPA: alpha/beta hydrolase [Mycobacteriales bacterium]|nr:alpha/beta hydrolase [Mycobacteriales bacterium]